jgi:putative transposase
VGINVGGERDILGMWIGPSGREGAKFWHSVLTKVANRGVADALVLCRDGPKGLPGAIRANWPQADVQLCVAHLVRNSLRYASKKHCGQIAQQLKLMRAAPAAEEAEFEIFAEQWREKYPAMVRP